MYNGFLKSTTIIIEHNHSTFCFPSMYKLGKTYGTLINFLPSFLQVSLVSILTLSIGKSLNNKHISHLIRWFPLSRKYTKIPFVHSKVTIQDLSGVPLSAFITNATTKVKQLNEVNILSRSHSLYSSSNPKTNHKSVSILSWNIRPEHTTKHSRNKKLNNIQLLCSDSEIGSNGCSTNNNGIGFSSWRTNSLGSEASMFMLEQPTNQLTNSNPHFTGYVGMELVGKTQSNSSSVELALTIAESLRKANPSGNIVELIGKESHWLTLQDRFIASGLVLEYGTLFGVFAFNNKAFNYILNAGKDKDEPLALAKILKAQRLFGVPERNGILCSNPLTVNLSW
ncbi:aconitase family protein [Candidatus Tremblaya phenacola]|uniref:aconitase family protein n=1 Tax=Candidatus Tremblayella phenacoccinincola TaxID=1010676 RepID=UPI0013300900|nr:aconitase family protein [Candidatus Tremblaya phenacola]KAH0998345.1 hypothetical protein FKM95_000070 [Candidatus Tremblaya phenacola]